MGLFGFVVSMIGLGAMTKDAISDSIFNEKCYSEAKAEGKPSYLGAGGKRYSTRTGRQVMIDHDFSTGHNWLVDINTGKRIDDATAYRNSQRTAASKANGNGGFYQTHEFDTASRMSAGIFVNDKIPGYFRKYDSRKNGIRITTYIKGTVKYDSSVQRNIIEVDWQNPKTEQYFEDGTPYTWEECERRRKAIEAARNRK